MRYRRFTWGSKKYMNKEHLEAMEVEPLVMVKGKTSGVPPPLTICDLPAEE